MRYIPLSLVLMLAMMALAQSDDPQRDQTSINRVTSRRQDDTATRSQKHYSWYKLDKYGKNMLPGPRPEREPESKGRLNPHTYRARLQSEKSAELRAMRYRAYMEGYGARDGRPLVGTSGLRNHGSDADVEGPLELNAGDMSEGGGKESRPQMLTKVESARDRKLNAIYLRLPPGPKCRVWGRMKKDKTSREICNERAWMAFRWETASGCLGRFKNNHVTWPTIKAISSLESKLEKIAPKRIHVMLKAPPKIECYFIEEEDVDVLFLEIMDMADDSEVLEI